MTDLDSMSVTPSVTSPDMIALTNEIDGLPALDLHALRSLWRQGLRTAPPPQLSRPLLLLRVLAYRLQAKVLGDLDPQTVRYLDRMACERERRLVNGEKRHPKAPPPVPPVQARQRLKPSTLLIREFGGILNKVTVVEGGYAWRDTVYDSLSAVAFAITGTKWNGPRFFGLRDKVPTITTSGAGTESEAVVPCQQGTAQKAATEECWPLRLKAAAAQNASIDKSADRRTSAGGIEVLP